MCIYLTLLNLKWIFYFSFLKIIRVSRIQWSIQTLYVRDKAGNPSLHCQTPHHCLKPFCHHCETLHPMKHDFNGQLLLCIVKQTRFQQPKVLYTHQLSRKQDFSYWVFQFHGTSFTEKSI